MTMYPGPVPARQQRPQAFMATPGLYASPSLLSRPQQQQPLYQQATPAPGWNLWLGLPPTSVQDWVADSGITGGGLWHDAPHHSIN
jgi:hypothetical protein